MKSIGPTYFKSKWQRCTHLLILCLLVGSVAPAQNKPNIILIMADDLGWGDVGFNGNPFIQTPHLDQMAANSVQFTRAYSGAPVCSPTRASCLTGRNAERHGIYFANVGHLPPEEMTLAEVLREAGYTTGFFGKWHLGTLTRNQRDGHRGGKEAEAQHFSPPWLNGFDETFATEVAVPTWDPMLNQMVPSKYWTGPDQFETRNLDGDDSRVIMDRVVPFIEKSARAGTPFFSVVWLHTPHSPVLAGPPYLAQYSDFGEDKKHYYGCITAMDEQIGRLRASLRQAGVDQNTLVFFTADNGPAGEGGGIAQHPGKRQQGVPGLFRGRKGSLYEGGVRVPGLLEWPARFSEHRKSSLPISTSDYLPTILALLGKDPATHPLPLDGLNILGLLEKDDQVRPRSIPFKSYKQRALTGNRYKIFSADDGLTYELYDLLNDPYETVDLAEASPDIAAGMVAELDAWVLSCEGSASGGDYKK